MVGHSLLMNVLELQLQKTVQVIKVYPFKLAFVYSVEETNKATCRKGEKKRTTKNFKDIESDLTTAREQIIQSDPLYKKKGEAEYQLQ